jgi:hypothetical protein
MYRSAPMLLLLACTWPPDRDHDQLSPEEELALGTDVYASDGDGDGLSDGQEVQRHGTDPRNHDSDGDGAADGWEVERGLDPLDPASGFYLAGWPHLLQADKDELTREPAPSVVQSGARLDALVVHDIHQQLVQLYDFALQDRPVVVFVGARARLDGLLRWLRDLPTEDLGSVPPEALRRRVLDQSVRLILVLSETPPDQDGASQAATHEVLLRLASEHAALDPFPIFRDVGYAAWGHLGRPGASDPDRAESAWTFVVLDQRMVVRGLDDWEMALALVSGQD